MANALFVSVVIMSYSSKWVSCFPAISATGGPPFCVPCLFYLVKERFILSKRWSLLVLYIIVFYPLWMLICTIKPFLTYSQCLYISVESFLIHPKCPCWSVGTVLFAFWLSSKWIVLLLLCTSVPLVLCCDQFDCGSRQVKHSPVDLVMEDYGIILCWWLVGDLQIPARV